MGAVIGCVWGVFLGPAGRLTDVACGSAESPRSTWRRTWAPRPRPSLIAPRRVDRIERRSNADHLDAGATSDRGTGHENSKPPPKSCLSSRPCYQRSFPCFQAVRRREVWNPLDARPETETIHTKRDVPQQPSRCRVGRPVAPLRSQEVQC